MTVTVIPPDSPPLSWLPHTSPKGFQSLIYYYWHFVIVLWFCIILLYCSHFYVNVFGCERNNLSFHFFCLFPLFFMGKLILIYKHFGSHACLQNELCLQSKILLYLKYTQKNITYELQQNFFKLFSFLHLLIFYWRWNCFESSLLLQIHQEFKDCTLNFSISFSLFSWRSFLYSSKQCAFKYKSLQLFSSLLFISPSCETQDGAG